MGATASQITGLTIVYLTNGLFRRRSKKTSKLRVTGLCEGNSPGTGDFPAQMASNAKTASIWWRHHAFWTHCGLLTPDCRYRSTSFRVMVCYLTVPSHYLIQCWLFEFCGIHLKPITRDVLKISILTTNMEYIRVELLPHLPQVKKLTCNTLDYETL